MNRTIEVGLTHAEGAIVRTLGLIERRGFVVNGVETRADPSGGALVLRVDVRSRGHRAVRRPGAPDPAAVRRAPRLSRRGSGRTTARMLNEAPAVAAGIAAGPAAARRFVVHKFGGSSLADAACFRRVADIVDGFPEPSVALVLSACRGVTDALINLVSAAEGRRRINDGSSGEEAAEGV